MTPVSAPDTTSAEAEVRGTLDAVARGHHARDAEEVARHYAADATIADLAPPLLHRSDPRGLQAWLDGWDGPVDLTYRDLAVTIDGNLALCHGLVHTRTTRGGEEAAWWARMTTALARDRDGWRIIHEHVSVPFHMDGSDRAATDLKPDN